MDKNNKCIIRLLAVIAAALLLQSCSESVITVEAHDVSGRIMFCDETFPGVTVTLVNERLGTITSLTSTDGTYYFKDVWSDDDAYAIGFSSDTVELYPPSIIFKVRHDDVVLEDTIVIKSWITVFGGNQTERINAVIQTSDYGFLVCGDIGSDTAVSGLITKYDRNGTISWSRTIDSTVANRICTVQEGTDGYYASGYSSTETTLQDTHILKLNKENGTTIWSYTSGSDNDDAALVSLVNTTTTTTERYVSAGYSQARANGSNDFFITQCDADGSNVLTGRYTTTENEMNALTGIVQADYVYYCCGTNGSGVSSRGYITTLQAQDLAQITYTNGIELDTITDTRGIAYSSDGYLYIAGTYRELITDPYKAYVNKYNSEDLTPVWSNTFDNVAGFEINGIITDRDGNLIIAGSIEISRDESVSDNYSTFRIMKLDANGKTIWDNQYPGLSSGRDGAVSVYQTHDGGYVVGGSITDSVLAVEDFAVVKLNRNGKIYNR